jgi:parvulin-like peptidyl-prolyl isomerase
MGLDKDDPVTRRRMAQKLEFLTRDIASMKEPAESELKAFFQANIEKYQSPDRISFTQVFLNPDKRGEVTRDDANALLAELRTSGVPDASVAEKGDSMMLQAVFEQQSEQQVSNIMGPRFASAVMKLHPGQWHGPQLSTYGTHLIYVSALVAEPEPVFDDVRDDVQQDWQTQRQEQFNEEFYQGLKSRYEIVFEGVPPLSENTGQSKQAVAENNQSGTRGDS